MHAFSFYVLGLLTVLPCFSVFITIMLLQFFPLVSFLYSLDRTPKPDTLQLKQKFDRSTRYSFVVKIYYSSPFL
jgi:hypothetical protein